MVLKAHITPAVGSLEDRSEPRRAMQLQTSGVLPDGQQANVTVHNLSSAGLLIETELQLETGEILQIDLPHVGQVEATIVWQSDRLFGGEFDQPINKAALASAQLQDVTRISIESQGSAMPGWSEPFGVRLNRMRRERGLTLAQIAEALEVSKPTVWAWEKGKARPLPERMDVIAQALNVSLDELTESDESGAANSIVENCRLKIATAFGTPPQAVKIMIEV